MKKTTLAGIASLLVILTPWHAIHAESTSASQQIGPLDVVASQSEFRNGDIQYKNAHLTGNNGLTLDADIIDVKTLSKTVTATGNVKAHIKRVAESQDITVNADKGSYDRVKNQIDLLGNVKVTIYSPDTVGPMIQTGDSAVVQLGPAPKYPFITMDHVHSTFTPAQQ